MLLVILMMQMLWQSDSVINGTTSFNVGASLMTPCNKQYIVKWPNTHIAVICPCMYIWPYGSKYECEIVFAKLWFAKVFSVNFNIVCHVYQWCLNIVYIKESHTHRSFRKAGCIFTSWYQKYCFSLKPNPVFKIILSQICKPMPICFGHFDVQEMINTGFYLWWWWWWWWWWW